MKELLTTELKIFYKVLYCFVAVFGLKEYKWKYRKLFFFILKVLKYLIFPLFSGVKLFFQLMRYSKTKPSKFFISFQAWETNEILVAVHCFLLESADDLSSLPSSSEKKRHLRMYRFKYNDIKVTCIWQQKSFSSGDYIWIFVFGFSSLH